MSCPNTWTQWGNRAQFGMSFADREPLRKEFPAGPYSNLGPVVVNDAEPGDVVECRMLRTWPIEWGWNSFPLGVGALPSDFDEPYVHYFRFNEDRTSAEFVDGTLSGPTIETAENWIVMAFAESLDAALPNCVRTAIEWLHGHGGIDRRDAYALCSMAVSFRVTQWANQTGSVYSSIPPRSIHAVIPESVLGELVAGRIDASIRPAS